MCLAVPIFRGKCPASCPSVCYLHREEIPMRHVTGIFIVILLAMAGASNAFGQQQVMPQMLRIVVDGKWGFIDQTGKIVVEPKFDAYGNLEDGLWAMQIEGKWGVCGRGRNAQGSPTIYGRACLLRRSGGSRGGRSLGLHRPD